jgi:hypothetical protein
MKRTLSSIEEDLEKAEAAATRAEGRLAALRRERDENADYLVVAEARALLGEELCQLLFGHAPVTIDHIKDACNALKTWRNEAIEEALTMQTLSDEAAADSVIHIEDEEQPRRRGPVKVTKWKKRK